MRSIGDVLDESRGLGKGFDFVRLALALSVATYHAIQMSVAKEFTGLVNVFVEAVLPMFFALSGFLITASALRLSLGNFLINRGLRIFPALCVEVILSAFVLGPIFTTLPLGQYFTDPKFFYYISNLVGTAYLRLPGVFGGNWVNGSIWTVPYEIGCYAIMSGLIFWGLLKRPAYVIGGLAALLAAQVLLAGLGYAGDQTVSHGVMDLVLIAPSKLASSVFHDSGAGLITSFLGGIAIYLLRYRIPYSPALLLASIAAVFIAHFALEAAPGLAPIKYVTRILPFVYIVTFLGLTPLPLPSFLHRGDYSYGIYLYGYPISMSIQAVLPEQSRSPWFLVFTSIGLIAVFAAFSWHAIERPILQLRKKFSFVARQRLDEGDGSPARATTSQAQHAAGTAVTEAG